MLELVIALGLGGISVGLFNINLTLRRELPLFRNQLDVLIDAYRRANNQ